MAKLVRDTITAMTASNYGKVQSADQKNLVSMSMPYHCTHVSINSARLVNLFAKMADNSVESLIEDALTLYNYTEANPDIDDIKLKLHQILGISARLYSALRTLWRTQSSRRYKDEDDRLLALMINANGSDDPGLDVRGQTISVVHGAAPITNDKWAQLLADILPRIYLTDKAYDFIDFLTGNVFKLKSDDETIRLMVINEYPRVTFDDESDESGNADYLSNDTTVCLDWFKHNVEYLQSRIKRYPFLRYVLMKMGAHHCGEDRDFTRDLRAKMIHVYYDRDGSLESAIYDAGGYQQATGIPALRQHTTGFGDLSSADYSDYAKYICPGLVSAPYQQDNLFKSDNAVPPMFGEVKASSLTILFRFCVLQTFNSVFFDIIDADGISHTYSVVSYIKHFVYTHDMTPSVDDLNTINFSNFINSACHNVQDANYYYVNSIKDHLVVLDEPRDYKMRLGFNDCVVDDNAIEMFVRRASLDYFYSGIDVPEPPVNRTKE